MLLKLSFVFASIWIAVVEVVNELTDTASRVGTLGMQGLLALMLICLGVVIFYLEKKRTHDRETRDVELKARFDAVVDHHEKFAGVAQSERATHMAEQKLAQQQLLAVTERSVTAMTAMATSTDALREWLKEHWPKPPPHA